MRTIVLTLTIFCSLTSPAQDYVVTSRRDTIRGRLSISSFPTTDKVQVTINKKKTEYPAHAVFRVYLDSQVYQPVRTLDAYRFMKLSRIGLVSIYYARQSPGTPYDVPYVVKRTGESMEVTALRFKKSMTGFLSECATIKQKIEEEQLGKKDLDRIISEYNKCIEQQTSKNFVASEDPRLVALNAFNEKLQKDSTVPHDALDIMKDLYSKIRENKAVPNYLTEGLKESLRNHPAYQGELEELLKKLKG